MSSTPTTTPSSPLFRVESEACTYYYDDGGDRDDNDEGRDGGDGTEDGDARGGGGYIVSNYRYETTSVVRNRDRGRQEQPPPPSQEDASKRQQQQQPQPARRRQQPQYVVRPVVSRLQFRTDARVPKLGVMLIGLGGNNGCTCVGGAIANRLGLSWETKEGTKTANYWGSVMMSSTVELGKDPKGQSVYIPMNEMLPMVHPNDIVWGGWDLSSSNLGDAMKRSKVFDITLQQQLYPHMKDIVPLPAIYFPDFIASNQSDRADHVLDGTKQEQMDVVRGDIRDFKQRHGLDKVIVLWTANTERFACVEEGVNDTAGNLLEAIEGDESEISASTVYAVASILEGCPFINGSPQNTFVPGVIDLARKHKKVFLAGDDFKSGQTKMKSVLVDFLVSAGIKPVSIVSYNHLGNNDGKNLSAPSQFRSKEISKSNVVDDMVASNRILYDEDEHLDHVVVIKYVPYVADSKRAMDEYTSEIFMGGKNTIVMHNTCEDSLLATPLIYDLVILGELCSRISMRRDVPVNNGENGTTTNGTTNGDKEKAGTEEDWETFHPVLSLLSYMLKAPLVPNGAPVVNALFAQRQAIINVMRACLGLPPENHMSLEHRYESTLQELRAQAFGRQSAQTSSKKRRLED